MKNVFCTLSIGITMKLPPPAEKVKETRNKREKKISLKVNCNVKVKNKEQSI